MNNYLKNTICFDDCKSASCKNCIDIHCSNMVDFSNSHENPYICLSEEEAQNWHKKCLPLESDPGYGEDYCQYNGSYLLKGF